MTQVARAGQVSMGTGGDSHSVLLSWCVQEREEDACPKRALGWCCVTVSPSGAQRTSSTVAVLGPRRPATGPFPHCGCSLCIQSVFREGFKYLMLGFQEHKLREE